MNLNEIKTALAAATPGPWMGLPDAVRSNKGPGGWICQTYDESNGNIVEFDNGEANIHLIANAPEWLASLVAEMERINGFREADVATVRSIHVENVRLRKQVEEMQKTIETAYGIACEDFESVNQMELIRLTLGESLQSLKGATK